MLCFEQETCPQCHDATDYNRWLEYNNNARSSKKAAAAKVEDKASSSKGYEVTLAHGWEPFYILSRDAPSYDESIYYYGFDRLAHVSSTLSFIFVFVFLHPVSSAK